MAVAQSEYEAIGLRLLRDDEKVTREVRDWRGVITSQDGPECPATCSQSVDDSRSTFTCSRPAKWVKDDATPSRARYCAQHAAGALRAAKNDQNRRNERADKARAERETEARAARLTKALGISVQLHFRSYPVSAWSEEIAEVTFDDLEKLAGRLAK